MEEKELMFSLPLSNMNDGAINKFVMYQLVGLLFLCLGQPGSVTAV